MLWCSLVRHCVTSREVASSIPDGVNGVLHRLNPSGCTMVLGVGSASTRSLCQSYLLGGKGGRCVGLANLRPSCADYLEILGASTSWSPNGLSRPVERQSADFSSCRGLRCGSAAVHLLGMRVRIRPGAWMYVVSVVCCQVEVSALV